MRISALLIVLMVVGPAGLAAAADFDAGFRAANRGDYAAALRAWRPLAKAGEPRAQYHLGMLYEEGRGVTRDATEAARWYRTAAKAGHAQAQNALAILYVEGRGLPRDPVEAYRWFALAAENGDSFAERNLNRLTGMLSDAQIAEGRDRARRGPAAD